MADQMSIGCRLLISLLIIWSLLALVPTFPADAAEIENELGVRFIIAPPEPAISEDLDGAVISEGGQLPVYVFIHREGTVISIKNQKLEFVCEFDIGTTREQQCFSQKLTIEEVFPLSHFGNSSHPMVITGKVGMWPVAIYAGLDGIPPQDRCKRFVATVSKAALKLAREVCPHTTITLEPILGTVFQYDYGTPRKRQRYSVRLTGASHDDLHYTVAIDSSSVQHADGPAALSRIMPLLTWCKSIVQRMYIADNGESISCSRTSSTETWQDTLLVADVRELHDPILATTLRSYKLNIKGTAENKHSSELDADIWSELGAPLRIRYSVSSGFGPGGLPPNTEYTEILNQVNLPAP